jgi:anti-sigma factor RsiW
VPATGFRYSWTTLQTKDRSLNCQETQKLIHAYVDSELDLMKNLEIEQHLQECPACAQAHRALEAVRARIKGENLYFETPSGLQDRIQSAVRPASRARPVTHPLRRPWLAVAASLLFVALAGWALAHFLPLRSPDALVTEELLASHVRSLLLPEHRVDVESSNTHTVKPWFEGKLDFSPPVHDFTGQGFHLVGGRLDYLDRRPVAALVYPRREHFINLFIWPSEQGPKTAPESLTRQGYHLLPWRQSGMTYWAVSNLNESELTEFARLVQEQGK